MSPTIARWIRRAEAATGIYTILAGIFGYGLGALLFDPVRGGFCSMCFFGLVGALEVRHRQAKAQIHAPNQTTDESHLFFALYDQHPQWHPKKIQEFTHAGFRWHTIGFEENPAPLALGGPFCSACGRFLAERPIIRFPGRRRYRFLCPCGHVQERGQSRAELWKEAAQIGNLPR